MPSRLEYREPIVEIDTRVVERSLRADFDDPGVEISASVQLGDRIVDLILDGARPPRIQ